MMSEADRRKAADILMSAEKARKQAVQLSKTWPGIAMEDAYAISTEVANRKIAAGAKLLTGGKRRGNQGWETRKAPGDVPNAKRREYQRVYRHRKRQEAVPAVGRRIQHVGGNARRVERGREHPGWRRRFPRPQMIRVALVIRGEHGGMPRRNELDVPVRRFDHLVT